MAHGAVIRLGAVANADNSLTFEQAGNHLKCIYFAFAAAVGCSVNDIYRYNKKLIDSPKIVHDREFNWDDSSFAVELAHRYGFKMHPAILYTGDIREKFNKVGTKMIVFYRINGDAVPDVPPDAKGKAFETKNFIRTILTAEAYDGIEFHAIYGEVKSTGIDYMDGGRPLRSLTGSAKSIVFYKNAP